MGRDTRHQGDPSDELPGVLAIGGTDVTTAFVSMSARHPEGRDAEYVEWHTLDHAPEQRRLTSLRHAFRTVSTPACRAARAISTERYDDVDHLMTYFFAGRSDREHFGALGRALADGGRMPLRLPSVAMGSFDLVGRAAARRVLVGADAVPWRPCTGVYLLVEQGSGDAGGLVEQPGVAGVWSFATDESAQGEPALQLTYCFLDGDPLPTAAALRAPLEARWADDDVVPFLAAPYLPVVPFDWARHLP